MRFISKLIFVGAVVSLVPFILFSSASSELIEPTRNLGEKAEQISRLTVLSEPPGLKITLDGEGLGETPLFLMQVKPGFHNLKVKNTETEIYLEPGKILKISLFRDEFVQIPVEAKPPEKKPEPQPQEKAAAPKAAKPSTAEIRKKKNTEQAQKRWQRFLDGSKPFF